MGLCDSTDRVHEFLDDLGLFWAQCSSSTEGPLSQVLVLRLEDPQTGEHDGSQPCTVTQTRCYVPLHGSAGKFTGSTAAASA